MINIENYFKESIVIFASLDLSILSDILMLTNVIIDEKIPTAGLSKDRDGFTIRFNPHFLKKYCDSPYKFAALFLHEILHHLLGHLELRNDMIKNIAFDAVINSTMYHLDKRFSELLKSTYSTVRFPEYLLRPESIPTDDSRTIYEKLWNTDSSINDGLFLKTNANSEITFDDLYSYLSRKMKNDIQILLLGSHDKEFNTEDETIESAGAEILSTLILTGKPYSVFNELITKITGKIKARKEQSLEKAFRNGLINSIRGKVIGSNSDLEKQKTICPTKITDRKDLFVLSQGFLPVFFKQHQPDSISGEVNLYLDVSGSVNSILPFIYSLVNGLKEYLSNSIYLFSNVVFRISKEELCNGKIKTTGGTDFDCVAKHILKNKIRSAVVITDGYAGISDLLASEVKRVCKIVGVLTTKNATSSIYKFTKEVHILPGHFFTR